ncbi:hypothetical protein LTS18_001781, partial [Coniosporium uncinatum]
CETLAVDTGDQFSAGIYAGLKQMPSRRHGYKNLDDLYTERDAVSWYWRVIALAASWMILAGYLVLPSTFDIEPKLRFSKGVLSIIIVALLTGGYSLTALLWFAVRTPLFHAESIFLPALGSCTFGLLATLYCFATSSRYEWSTPAGITIALSVASSLGYGALLFFTQRKINQIRSVNTAAVTSARHISTHTVNDSVGGGTWQEPNYYTNYIANMHPTARTPSPSFSSHNSVYDQHPAPGPGYPNIYTLDEDELVNQQMAMLLRKADTAPSPDASQATFRIDLPDAREDDAE